MANSNRRNIKSCASSGYPLHPLMVHFPVAALMALVACDLGYWYTDDPFWLRVGLWLAGIGALGGWLASIAGIIDLVSVRPNSPSHYRLEPRYCRCCHARLLRLTG